MSNDLPASPCAEFPTDADVQAVVEEFGGDPWSAIRALLHELEVLAGDYDASVSHGFVRGGVPRLVLNRRA